MYIYATTYIVIAQIDAAASIVFAQLLLQCARQIPQIVVWLGNQFLHIGRIGHVASIQVDQFGGGDGGGGGGGGIIRAADLWQYCINHLVYIFKCQYSRQQILHVDISMRLLHFLWQADMLTFTSQ